MGIIIQVFVVGSEKCISFCNRVRIGRSKSPKVDDFGTNRKCVCNFLRHSDLGPIVHRFWDTASYWLKLFFFNLPIPLSFDILAPGGTFGSSRWSLPQRNWSRGAILQWIPHDRSLSHFDTVTDKTADGQTDISTIDGSAVKKILGGIRGNRKKVLFRLH